MIKLFLSFVFLLIQPTESVISEIQNKFESIKYLHADFKQSTNANAISGKFYFAKENNYRIELNNNIIISDGETIWNEDTKRKKVVISNLEDDPLSFSISEYIYDYPPKCEIKEEKINDGYIVTLDASDAELNFKTVELFVSNNYLINKIFVTDFGGNKFKLIFSNIYTNAIIESDMFSYQNNSSNKIIDLR